MSKCKGVVAVLIVLTLDLDGDDPPPFENEVTSLQVLIGGAAELNMHLLIETEIEQSLQRHRKLVHHFGK